MYLDGANYIKPRIEAESSSLAMLAAYVRSNLEFIRDHIKEIAAVAEISINVRSRDGVPRFAGGPGGMKGTIGPLQELLRRGQINGDFADFDTRTMAWAIRNLIDGINRQRLLDPAFDFARTLDELTALVTRATRKTFK